MKAEIKTVEREVVTVVKDEVITITLSKGEASYLMDVLHAAKNERTQDNQKTAERAWRKFGEIQNRTCNNLWWASNVYNHFDSLFKE